MTPGQQIDKDCQTEIDVASDQFEPMDGCPQGSSELSAIEKKRLSLEQRIKARKTVVQDSDVKNQDQEIKSLRYEIEILQKKLATAEDEKALADLRAQEQELNIQEQFEIITDYSNEIKEHNAREKMQN